MTAVALALLSAFLFGGMSVALRVALGRYPDVELATVAAVAGALLVALGAAAVEAPTRGVHAAAAWPFLLAGLLQPGVGQLFFTLAVHEAGASRASVVFGAAPLVSVTIALLLLDEPVRAPLIVGAVLIVAGGFELAREPERPEHFRMVGLAYAFVVVVLFATRDNLLRWLSQRTSAPSGVAAAATLLGAAALIAVVLGPRLRRRSALPGALSFLGIGVLFGLSYVSLFEAYYRGRVTVVSPLVATESLWGVALAALVLPQVELVGRRLVLGTLAIVTGGALIGAFR